jgi:hypothetical protein
MGHELVVMGTCTLAAPAASSPRSSPSATTSRPHTLAVPWARVTLCHGHKLAVPCARAALYAGHTLTSDQARSALLAFGERKDGREKMTERKGWDEDPAGARSLPSSDWGRAAHPGSSAGAWWVRLLHLLVRLFAPVL